MEEASYCSLFEEHHPPGVNPLGIDFPFLVFRLSLSAWRNEEPFQAFVRLRLVSALVWVFISHAEPFWQDFLTLLRKSNLACAWSCGAACAWTWGLWRASHGLVEARFLGDFRLDMPDAQRLRRLLCLAIAPIRVPSLALHRLGNVMHTQAYCPFCLRPKAQETTADAPCVCYESQ